MSKNFNEINAIMAKHPGNLRDRIKEIVPWLYRFGMPGHPARTEEVAQEAWSIWKELCSKIIKNEDGATPIFNKANNVEEVVDCLTDIEAAYFAERITKLAILDEETLRARFVEGLQVNCPYCGLNPDLHPDHGE